MIKATAFAAMVLCLAIPAIAQTPDACRSCDAHRSRNCAAGPRSNEP